MNTIINIIKRKYPNLTVNINSDDEFEVGYYHKYNTNKLTFKWANEKLYLIKEFLEFLIEKWDMYDEYEQNFNVNIDVKYVANLVKLWMDEIKHGMYTNMCTLLSQNPEFYHKSKLELCNDLVKLEFPQLDVNNHYNNILNVDIYNEKYSCGLKFKLKNDNIYLAEEYIYSNTDDSVCRGSIVCDIQIEEDRIVHLLNLWLNYGWYAGGEKFVEELLNEHIGPKSARKV